MFLSYILSPYKSQALHARIKETEETQKKLQQHLNKTLGVRYTYESFQILESSMYWISWSDIFTQYLSDFLENKDLIVWILNQMLQFVNSSFSGAPRPGETHWAIEECSQGQGPATQSGSGTFFYMVTIIHTILLSFMTGSLKTFTFRQDLRCDSVCLEMKPALI